MSTDSDSHMTTLTVIICNRLFVPLSMHLLCSYIFFYNSCVIFSPNSLQLITIQILILINHLLFNIFVSESILLFNVMDNAEGARDASGYVAFQIEWAHREAWGSMHKVCDKQKQLQGDKESILYCSCLQGREYLCSGFRAL